MKNFCTKFISFFFLFAFFTDLSAQSYSDGPIELQVRVCEINTQVGATDASFLGIGFSPDEMTYFVWARDNGNYDATDWTGGQCLTQNFNPPGVSSDFNTVVFSYTYPTATVPQFFDIRGDFYEDDAGSDFLCGGGRCNFDNSTCCGVIVFGACIGVTEEDDNHCVANPLATNMDYRLGSPCQWYDHGFVAACGGSYQPRIKSYWRYTRGTNCSNTLNLGTLPAGGTLSHFNSNECYSNNFSASPGKDVFYEFNTIATTGVIISLCGAGTSFNTVLYLLDASCNPVSSNDNSCGNVSQITANLCTPGTYKLVIDGALASSQGTFSLTITDDPSALIAVNVTGTDVLCNGGSDGTATANVTNGSSPFTFVWNPNVGNTQTVTGLSAGGYLVTVTDVTGCQATGSVVINEPAVLSFTTSVTAPTCNGGNDASITVTASGGIPAYQYSSDGGNIFQNSNILSGLDAGTYSVVVKDANNCTVTNSVVITDPTAIQPNLTVTNITCNGANDGSVVSNPTNGTVPYEFSLDSGPFVSTNSFTGLSTGFHLLNVRDANGCEKAEGFNIFEPANLTSLVTVINAVKCNGGADGSFTITGVGGSLPYSYSLDDIIYQPTGTFNNLVAGIYNIYVKDNNDCQALNTVTITEPAPLSSSVLFQINISCTGSTDGAVVLTASGGTGPYQFSDDHIFYSTSGFFDRLIGGTYTYYVKDNNNCEDSVTFTIFEPSQLTLSPANVINATCLGVNDGSITLHAGGGTPPYKFSIDGGAFQTDSTFTGLTAGAYDFTVRDDNFCELTQSLSIGFITTITLSISKSNLSCSGDSSGSITIFASNGQTPYGFSLDGIGFQASNAFNNLPAGDYTVTVKDANGCLAIQQVSITEPGPLDVTLVQTRPASCFNTTDGSADIDVTGGNTPYSFLWSNGAVTQNLVNVEGGNYTVTVTDATFCTATLSLTVGQSPPIFIDIESIKNVSCNGAGDAYINVSVNGGTPGYIYVWSNGNNTEDLVDLGPGSYSLTVGDANNCSLNEIYTITSPTGLFVSIESVTDAVCANGDNGSISVSATGGTAPLAYSLDGYNFQTGANFTGLSAGNYNVVVKDDNGCTSSESATISEGGDIFFSYGNDFNIINGQSVQLQPILIPDDVAVDSVIWEPTTALSCSDCINPVANPTETTVYTVTLIDSNGCVANTVVRIVVRDDWQIYVPNIFTPNGDEVNDRFSFHSYGTSNIAMRIYNRWGGQVYYNPNQQPNTPAEGWDGMYNGKEAQQGAYTYLLNVLYTNNEERQKTGTITLVR